MTWRSGTGLSGSMSAEGPGLTGHKLYVQPGLLIDFANSVPQGSEYLLGDGFVLVPAHGVMKSYPGVPWR